MEVCRGIINCTWQTWLVWHIQNGSAKLIRQYLADVDAWGNSDPKTRGPKPKWPVDPFPKDCGKQAKNCADTTYYAVAEAFPEIETNARELCRSATVGKITHLKAAHGSLSGWAAILLHRQNLPSSVRAIPIPFSKKNAGIIAPDENDPDGCWRLWVRLSRTASAEGKNGSSTKDVVRLWSRGRRAAGQVAILQKILSGEYEFCGSNMVYSESKRKWFAKICYRAPRPAPQALDATRMAFLRPTAITAIKPGTGRCPVPLPRPWRLRLPTAIRWPGGKGDSVYAVRRSVIAQRVSRQHGYRYAGSANKGHGLNRALKPIWHLQQRWKDFVKTFNYQVAKDVVRQCVESRCGVLYYFQPGGWFRDNRFLSRAGKRDDVQDASAWDWFQIGSRLEFLCEEAGIEFRWQKPDRREAEKSRPSDKPEGPTARKPIRKSPNRKELQQAR